MRPIKLALALLALTTANAHATGSSSSSTCNAQIQPLAPIATVAYDPFDGVSRSVTFPVVLQNNGAEACYLSLAVASQTAGSTRYLKNGAQQLRYVIEWEDGSDLPNNITSPQGSIYLQGGAGKTKSVTLRLKVPSGLVAPAATYTDLMTFRAYKGSTKTGSDVTANGSALVETRAQVNIAGASAWNFGAFGVDLIDFNTLQTNETRYAVVQVRATTTPVTITVTSQNSGRLKHKMLIADPGVPYAVRLDNVPLVLLPSAQIIRTLGVSLEGMSYPLKLQIGDVAGRPAGNYQDMLTFTVAP